MLDYLLGVARLVPHGHCQLWRPDLIALHAASDLTTAVAFLSLPTALLVSLRRRTDLGFSWLLALLAAFVLASGTGHLVELATVWWPVYDLQGLVKAGTALVSVATALAVWSAIPRAQTFPSPAVLREANARLEAEAAVRVTAEAALRRAHDELEVRVAARTRELAEANERLAREVEERRRAKDRLAEAERDVRRLAHHDPLTGLPNRLLFQERLEQALARARREGERVAVTLLDLDDFKDVNDSLGHAAGDQLLKGVADRLRRAARESDTWARLGGDEFALVQPGLRAPADAGAAAWRVVEALAAPLRVEEHEVEVTASLGVTVFPDDGDTPERLVRNADVALYRAKAGGRRRFEAYRPEMDVVLQETRSVQKGLRQALESGALRLAYQPVFALPILRPVKAEALLRWPHPGGGLVPPSGFIPVAEASGLIHALGGWALREACRQAAAWRAAGTPLKVAVNVSPAQLRHPDFPRTVRDALDGAGLGPGLLELELTESVFLDPSKEQILSTLRRVADLGVTLAIDDFGTGYSSLAYLRHFPFDEVKVDGSFVADIGREPGGEAIVAAVVALAHSLGKRATAEGVETEGQLAFLRERGCDAAQGYLLGRPVPAEEIARLALAADGGVGRGDPVAAAA